MKKLFMLLLMLVPTQQYAVVLAAFTQAQLRVKDQHIERFQAELKNLAVTIDVLKNQNTILTAEITNLRNEKNQEKAALQEIIRSQEERLEQLTQIIQQSPLQSSQVFDLMLIPADSQKEKI